MANKKKKNKKNSKKDIGIVITIALLVIVVIAILVGNGNQSSTSDSSTSSNNSSSAVVATIEGDSQNVEINVLSGSYTPIIVQKGIPVKFNLKADSSNLTGCNSTIKISEYEITKSLQVGDNIVEFTPTETGTFTYTCYMGMISSSITVVDDLKNIDSSVQSNINAVQKSGGCSCGGGN